MRPGITIRSFASITLSAFLINALKFQPTSALLSKLIYQPFIFVLWHGFLH